MAIKTKVTAVSTTRVAVTSADTDITSKGFVTLTNYGDHEVYLGGATVTAATGYALLSGKTLENIELKNNEVLYGICATGESVTVHALQVQA